MKTSQAKFITLGCKVNQYETQGMREALERSGVEDDIVVINTCTVTHEADRMSRYWIRRARRDYPNARIVVTGCGVERDRAKIESLPEVDFVLSNCEKAEIASRLLESCAAPSTQENITAATSEVEAVPLRKWRWMPLSISRTEGIGRAFVKIQDGCNHACSFCKVVLVRGRSRSRAPADIVDEVTRLRDSGYKEIVFAGIQLGAYGEDSPGAGGIGLPDVLEACSEVEGIERLRLSSIEPADVTPSLIEALRDIPKCAPHLHIPLQSGDDEILTRMNRRCRAPFYEDLVSRLRAELPDFSLTLDVMAGFPGEEEFQYENTRRLLEKVRPLKCHVFPYSRREGTRAARLGGDLPAKIIRQRTDALIEFSEELGRKERLLYLGRIFSVLVESKEEIKGELRLEGLTPNYLKVSFADRPEGAGGIFSVKLVSLAGGAFKGEIVFDADGS